MNTETRKVLAVVALIVTTGIATVELTRSPALADPTMVSGGAAGYAGQRVEEVFKVASEMPAVASVSVPVAMKGDLTETGCFGPLRPDFAGECFDAAYEVESGPYVVVETRGEASSILTRMMGYTVADFRTTMTE